MDFCDITRLQISPLDDKHFMNASYVHAAIWRYFALGDRFVDVVSFRDTDSFILPREVDSVNVWLNSTSKVAHIMRGYSVKYSTNMIRKIFNYLRTIIYWQKIK